MLTAAFSCIERNDITNSEDKARADGSDWAGGDREEKSDYEGL